MPVNTPNDEFGRYIVKWKRCRDTFDGQDAVKAANETYLPKIGGDEPGVYDAYKMLALYFNAVAPTVVALTGAVFMKDPQIEAVPESVLPYLDDITMNGQSLVQFARDVVGQVVHPGRFGILVDLPDDPAPGKDRPYLVGYRAEDIINWRARRSPDGEIITTFVVLKEANPKISDEDPFVTVIEDRYRVLTLNAGVYQQQLWVRNPDQRGTDQNEWILERTMTPMRRGVELNFIPFTFVGPEGVQADISDPPLMALVDVNLSHYRTSADLEWGSHFTALPTPVISGTDTDRPIHIGSTKALILPDPQAKAYYLEFAGAGLAQLRENEKTKRTMMASLGGRLLDESGMADATATAVRLRHSGEHASLLTIALAVSHALTRCVQWMVWWTGFETEVSKEPAIRLSTDFYPTKLTPDELTKLMLAWQGNAISFETFFHLLSEGGIYPEGTTLEDEKLKIDQAADEAQKKALEIAGGEGGPIPELEDEDED